MGWARYAHSMRVFVLNSGLFYIRWVAQSMGGLWVEREAACGCRCTCSAPGSSLYAKAVQTTTRAQPLLHARCPAV